MGENASSSLGYTTLIANHPLPLLHPGESELDLRVVDGKWGKKDLQMGTVPLENRASEKEKLIVRNHKF